MRVVSGRNVAQPVAELYLFSGCLLLPPLFFFLSSMIYLTGGLLGGMWSRERLRLRGLSRAEVLVTLFVLLLSISFLLLGILFVVVGFRRL